MEKNTGILKRTLSFFLAVLITLSSVPLPALATENVTIPTETVAETETVEVVTEPTEAPEGEPTAPAEETEEHYGMPLRLAHLLEHAEEPFPIYQEMFVYPAFIEEILSFAR